MKLSGTPMTSSLWAGLTTGSVFPAALFLDTPLAFAPLILVVSLQLAMDMAMVAMDMAMVAMNMAMVAMEAMDMTMDMDKERLPHYPPSQLLTKR